MPDLRPEPSSCKAHQRLIATEPEQCMTFTIDLPDEQLAALVTKARAQGLAAEQYVRLLVERDLAPPCLWKSWETSGEASLDQPSTEEIDAEIAAARQARSLCRT